MSEYNFSSMLDSYRSGDDSDGKVVLNAKEYDELLNFILDVDEMNKELTVLSKSRSPKDKHPKTKEEFIDPIINIRLKYLSKYKDSPVLKKLGYAVDEYYNYDGESDRCYLGAFWDVSGRYQAMAYTMLYNIPRIFMDLHIDNSNDNLWNKVKRCRTLAVNARDNDDKKELARSIYRNFAVFAFCHIIYNIMVENKSVAAERMSYLDHYAYGRVAKLWVDSRDINTFVDKDIEDILDDLDWIIDTLRD